MFKRLAISIISQLCIAAVMAAQYIPSVANSTELVARQLVKDGVTYQIHYAFDTTTAVVPAVYGLSAVPHYDAKINVYRLDADGSMVPIYTKHGTFVEAQCGRDGPCGEPCCDGATAVVEEALRPQWKVWYDDGGGLNVFHSGRNSWKDVPTAPGVQIVLVCEAKEWKRGHPYRRLLAGSDWYWLDDKGIPQQSIGDGAPNGKWTEKPHQSARAGISIPDGVFEQYKAEAIEDATCSE